MRVAVALRESQIADGPKISREIIRLLATNPPLLGNTYQIRRPNAVFQMAELASLDYRRTVQDTHVEHFMGGSTNPQLGLDYDAELEALLAESFVTHVASLSADQKSRLRQGISAWNNVRPELLKILSSTKAAREAFIEPTALVKLLGNVKIEDILTFSTASDSEDDYDETFLVLIRCREMG